MQINENKRELISNKINPRLLKYFFKKLQNICTNRDKNDNHKMHISNLEPAFSLQRFLWSALSKLSCRNQEKRSLKIRKCFSRAHNWEPIYSLELCKCLKMTIKWQCYFKPKVIWNAINIICFPNVLKIKHFAMKIWKADFRSNGTV